MAPINPDAHHEDAPTTRGLRPSQKVGAGRFTLVSPLGEGGMGVVWKAADATLGGMVALKFLPFEISADPTAIEDLRRETSQSRRLSHPNIVRVYDLYEDITPFIFMEYVEGHTLSHERVRHPRRVLPWSFLAPYIAQLCDALDYAHRERIVHRDLKPSNVLLDPQRALIKLVDFGIARIISESVTRVTMKKPAEGTILYMSCQQLNGEPASQADDIYSLGVTLYELLTSKPPFHSGDTAWQIRYGEIAPVSQRLTEFNFDNDVPPHVEKAVMACLARDPFKRPPTARDVAELLGLLDYRGGRSRTGTPRPSPRPTPATLGSRQDPQFPDEVATDGAVEAAADAEPQPPTPRPSPRRPTTTQRIEQPPPPTPASHGIGPYLLAISLVAAITTGIIMLRKSDGQIAARTGSTNTAYGSARQPDELRNAVPVTNNLGAPLGKTESPTETAAQPSSPGAQTSSMAPPAILPPHTLDRTNIAPITNIPPAASIPVSSEPLTLPPPAPKLVAPPPAPLFPVSNAPWTNSLGMRFVPVSGLQPLFSIWETRTQDYNAFADANPKAADTRWKPPTGPAPNLPVVNVTWSNAVAFCEWLTRMEREAGNLAPDQRYRLPTDLEWSLAAGLIDESKSAPASLTALFPNERRFSWGTNWPPSPGTANLRGAEVLKSNPQFTHLKGYDDSFPGLAPVGSFPGGRLNNLLDLTGNAAEWCQDLYSPNAGADRVTRGGSCEDYDPRHARLRCRSYERPGNSKPFVGFRCVLDPAAR